MLMLLFLGVLATVVVGTLPLWVRGKIRLAAGLAVAGAIGCALIYYFAVPSFTGTLFGVAGFCALALMILSAIIDGVSEDEVTHATWFPVLAAIVYCGLLTNSCSNFHASHYASLIGPIEERVWTQDVQPKDPRHVRLVPQEFAEFLASTHLGKAEGTIGSQFSLATDYVTLQLINNDLQYLIPLDYNGFSSWKSTDGVPGYILVDAEDPKGKVTAVFDRKYLYTPQACFGYNLQRHLRAQFPFQDLSDYSLERDENGREWWIVTVSHPTISYFGTVVDGIAKVDPVSGAATEKLQLSLLPRSPTVPISLSTTVIPAEALDR